MLSKTRKYLVISTVSLVLFGCGTDTLDLNNKNIEVKGVEDLRTFSDAEKLAYVVANQKNTIETDIRDIANKNLRAMQSCKDSGTIEFITMNDDINNGNMNSDEMHNDNMSDENMNNDNMNDDNMYNGMMSRGMGGSTVKYIECSQNGKTLNGNMKFSMNNNTKTGSMIYLSDFSSTDEKNDIFIKAGGKILINKKGEWDILTINLQMTLNNITHKAKELVFKSKELKDGGFLEFPVSGKETIGESANFMIDPHYDVSKTPFKTNKKEELISGMFKYLDDHNHSVELEIISKNTIAVRVDENSDGNFDESEMSVIKLKR